MAVSTEFRIIDKATAVITKISSKIDAIAMSFNKLENNARMGLSKVSDSFPKLNSNAVNFFNRMSNGAGKMANNIIDKIKSIKVSFQSLFSLYLVFKGLQQFFNLNDKIINSNIKLGLMGKNKEERTLIEKRIFNTSQKLGVDYTDFQSQVYKLSKITGDTFKNEFEAIRFNDIMQKVFKVSGASTVESSNAMYQLTQALGSGRLQGDEFRSISEQAPLLSRKIAETMGVSYRELKKLGSEGKITADVIKKAVFDMADDVDKKVAAMPLTWAQRFNQVSNYILNALKPALMAFQKLGNNPLVINVFRVLGVVVYAAAFIISGFVTVLDKVFSVINYLLPVLATLAIMITLIYSKVLIITAATAIWNTITGIATLVTGGFTAAFAALDTAMWANPIGAIIAAVIGLIAVFIGVIKILNKLSGTTHTVLGSIIGGFLVLAAVIGNIFVGLWNGIKTFINTVASAFGDLGQAIAMAFKNPFRAVGYMIRGLMSYILGALKSVASISDTIIGTNYAGKIGNYEKGLDTKLNSFFGLSEKRAPIFKMTQRFDYKTAFDKGAKIGDNWQNKLASIFKKPKPEKDNDNIENYLKGINNNTSGIKGINDNTSPIKGIHDNTSGIKSNTDEYKENIKLMRDLANRDMINKVSAPTIKVEVYQSNAINDANNTDNIFDKLGDDLSEAVNRALLGGVF